MYKRVTKYFPELIMFLSSLFYVITQVFCDIRGLHYPIWVTSIDVSNVSLFMLVIVLIYRSKGEKNEEI